MVLDFCVDDFYKCKGKYKVFEKITPTLLAEREGLKVVEMNEEKTIKIIGVMDNSIDHTFESANRIYDKEGIAPTIPTCAGGGIQPKVIDELPVIVASRGRNPVNPSSREKGITLKQRLEVNSKGISNTLTTVQKDNLVLDSEIKKIGNVSTGNSQGGSVFNPSGLAPTLCAGVHGYAMGNVVYKYRIRKLTPKECWRLMSFSDENFEKARKVKESFSIIGGNNKCNVKLMVVKENQKLSNSDTYVCCTTKDFQEQVKILTEWKLLVKKPESEKTLNVNFVIEKLEETELLDYVTNTTKWNTFMGIRYILINENDLLHHTVIIAQVKKDKANIEKYMKISMELNLPQINVFIILTLSKLIIESKIYTSTILKANILGCIVPIDICSNNISLKILNLSMESIRQRVSNSELYKQAGNSIVVSCLIALFSQLNIKGHAKWNDMTNEERYKLIYKGGNNA